MNAHQLSAHVDALALKISQIDAPAWYLSAGYKELFKDATVYADVVSSSPLTVAPIISDLLTSTSPPTSVQFMSNLPLFGKKKLWGAYGLVLKKDGSPDKLYVGTGLDARDGVYSRLDCYKHLRRLPRFVERALEDGYTITASGLLCWTDLPTPSLAPRLNARFKMLESVFTILLRASFPTSCDFYIEDFFLWKGQAVPWGPLCSHLPLVERIRFDVDLTQQQLDEIAEARKQRAHDAKYAAYHKDGAGAAEKAISRAKVIESEEHTCKDCKVPFQSASALKSHYGTESHRYVVEHGKKKPLSRSGMSVAKTKAKGTHRCTPCNKTFGSDSQKLLHFKNDKKHDAKVRAYAAMHGSDSDDSTVAPVQTSLLKFFSGGKGSE
jgi:hypothetical protein